jgi:endogenous inhibitor of DNA gyrase (YacG/DUF329 family)
MPLCPQCNQTTSLNSDNAWRPFCSERCKLLDLGEWFGERYTVAVDSPEGDLPGQNDDGTLQ